VSGGGGEGGEGGQGPEYRKEKPVIGEMEREGLGEGEGDQGDEGP
jgi:hypothetical protein